MIRVLRVAYLPQARIFHRFLILVLLMCALGQTRSQRNEEEKALGNTTPPASLDRVIKTPMLSSLRSDMSNPPAAANPPATLDSGKKFPNAP
jgi:hypothetical protein